MSLRNCPKCKIEFDNHSRWGPKKFCSRKCSNSRLQTDEIKLQKSIKLSKKTECKYCNKLFISGAGAVMHQKTCIDNPNRIPGSFFDKTHTDETKSRIGQNNSMGLRVPKSLLDMSKRTSSKIMKRLGLGCFTCNWNLGSCDLHHILPRSQGGTDDSENLTYICPNCHRLAHEKKLTKFVSIRERIGEKWREFYFAHK